MTTALIAARTFAQGMAGQGFDSPADVVRHFGCMQSQDFAMAKWAIGRRCPGSSEATIDTAFATGTFVRTHILRPTWHCVAPDELRWMMSVTAPRVHRLMATSNKAIALREAELDKAAGVIGEALTGGQPLTRRQLADHLREAGMECTGTRLAHIMIHCELEALICSGPMAGNHHTYVLLPQRCDTTIAASDDDLLARLAQTYVRGHGPSRPADLSWWSSLTLAQSRQAFELAGLTPMRIDGQSYWGSDWLRHEPPVAALMPPFDESISYVDKPIDHHAMLGNMPDLARGGGLLFVRGLISGSWRRQIRATAVEIEVVVRCAMSSGLAAAIEAEAGLYATFVDRPLALRINVAK